MEDPLEDKEQAYVAGWGKPYDTCWTIENGPNPYMPCKETWEFEGETYGTPTFSGTLEK